MRLTTAQQRTIGAAAAMLRQSAREPFLHAVQHRLRGVRGSITDADVSIAVNPRHWRHARRRPHNNREPPMSYQRLSGLMSYWRENAMADFGVA